MEHIENQVMIPKPVRSIPLLLRALAALFFASLLTSLVLFGFLHGYIYWAKSLGPAYASRLFEPASFWPIFLLMLIIAAFFALIIEWPKSRWMIRRRGNGMFIGILVSAILAMTFNTLFLMGFINATNTPQTAFYSNLINMIVGLLIGGSSGLFWWRLVIAPERKKRSVPVVAAQFA